jgi:hypothetical protein
MKCRRTRPDVLFFDWRAVLLADEAARVAAALVVERFRALLLDQEPCQPWRSGLSD